MSSIKEWEEKIGKWNKETLEKFVRAVDELMSISDIEKEYSGFGLATLKYIANSRLKNERF